MPACGFALPGLLGRGNLGSEAVWGAPACWPHLAPPSLGLHRPALKPLATCPCTPDRAVELFDWLRRLEPEHPLRLLLDVYSYTAAISLCISEHNAERALQVGCLALGGGWCTRKGSCLALGGVGGWGGVHWEGRFRRDRGRFGRVQGKGGAVGAAGTVWRKRWLFLR